MVMNMAEEGSVAATMTAIFGIRGLHLHSYDVALMDGKKRP